MAASTENLEPRKICPNCQRRYDSEVEYCQDDGTLLVTAPPPRPRPQTGMQMIRQRIGTRKGCGCAIAVLVVFLALGALVYFKFIKPLWDKKTPPPSGTELRVHILDVGQGDSILILGPEDPQTKERKVALVDAGDRGRDKAVIEALDRNNVKQIDLFVATHPHADHIGSADEVIKNRKVLNVLYSGVTPEARATPDPNANSNSRRRSPPPARRGGRPVELPTTKTYTDFLAAVQESGAKFIKAEPGEKFDQKFDLGGGAVITVLAPIQPLFTDDQLRSGGNVPNANSVVVRLDYGDFSIVLTGDAEKQTEEERLIAKGAPLEAKILKVGHHGSKYASSENFIKTVAPEVAVISDGENNRYGHPSQAVLDRLRNANVKVFRTDLHGEITITTKGKLENGKLFDIKTAKEPKTDVWAGREPQKDDSERSGFISYGDFGPPPRERRSRERK